MRSFTKLYEQNEINLSLSNKHRKLKEILLENLTYDNKEDLMQQIQINLDSLNVNGKSTFKNLQELDSRIDFIIEYSNELDAVLLNTQWFNQSPMQNSLKSIKTWLNTSLDIALKTILKDLLDDLKNN